MTGIFRFRPRVRCGLRRLFLSSVAAMAFASVLPERAAAQTSDRLGTWVDSLCQPTSSGVGSTPSAAGLAACRNAFSGDDAGLDAPALSLTDANAGVGVFGGVGSSSAIAGQGVNSSAANYDSGLGVQVQQLYEGSGVEEVQFSHTGGSVLVDPGAISNTEVWQSITIPNSSASQSTIAGLTFSISSNSNGVDTSVYATHVSSEYSSISSVSSASAVSAPYTSAPISSVSSVTASSAAGSDPFNNSIYTSNSSSAGSTAESSSASSSESVVTVSTVSTDSLTTGYSSVAPWGGDSVSSPPNSSVAEWGGGSVSSPDNSSVEAWGGGSQASDSVSSVAAWGGDVGPVDSSISSVAAWGDGDGGTVGQVTSGITAVDPW